MLKCIQLTLSNVLISASARTHTHKRYEQTNKPDERSGQALKKLSLQAPIKICRVS
jgi:hypothetical protein